jgi:hypothetical protein
MEPYAPLLALAGAALLPLPHAQTAAGVLALAYTVWKDKWPSPRQGVVAAWTLWALQRAYLPALLQDEAHVTDVALLVLGGVYFGLGLHRTLDPSLYHVASAALALAACAPVRPVPSYVEGAASSALFVAAACALEFAEQRTENALPAQHRAMAAGWMLFVRFELIYVVFEVLQAAVVLHRAYAQYEKNADKFESAPAPSAQNAPRFAHPVARQRPVFQAAPKPVVVHKPIYQTGVTSDFIDPEARSVEPFAIRKS